MVMLFNSEQVCGYSCLRCYDWIASPSM